MRALIVLTAALLAGLPSEAHPGPGAKEGGSTDLIDRRIAERWESEGLKPAPLADDYEYFRRLSLDLRGVIPAPDEIRKFAADADAAKREKTADAWLRSEAFAASWSRR